MGDATFSTRVASGKGWGALREGGACPRGPRRTAGAQGWGKRSARASQSSAQDVLGRRVRFSEPEMSTSETKFGEEPRMQAWA